jgi:tripartite-type tricarboxylate transporter receptor subunit TctC
MDKLAAAVDTAMKSASVSDRLKTLGIEPIGGTRADFNVFVDQERARLGVVVREARMSEN